MSEEGRKLSRTGSKHDGIEAQQENPKLDENLNFSIMEVIDDAEGSGNIYRQGQSSDWSLLKIFSSSGREQKIYSGLIADQKFTGRTNIRPMDREARGGPLHGFRTWCQPSNKLSVYRSLTCRHARKQYMQPDM